MRMGWRVQALDEGNGIFSMQLSERVGGHLDTYCSSLRSRPRLHAAPIAAFGWDQHSSSLEVQTGGKKKSLSTATVTLILQQTEFRRSRRPRHYCATNSGGILTGGYCKRLSVRLRRVQPAQPVCAKNDSNSPDNRVWRGCLTVACANGDLCKGALKWFSRLI